MPGKSRRSSSALVASLASVFASLFVVEGAEAYSYVENFGSDYAGAGCKPRFDYQLGYFGVTNDLHAYNRSTGAFPQPLHLLLDCPVIVEGDFLTGVHAGVVDTNPSVNFSCSLVHGDLDSYGGVAFIYFSTRSTSGSSRFLTNLTFSIQDATPQHASLKCFVPHSANGVSSHLLRYGTFSRKHHSFMLPGEAPPPSPTGEPGAVGPSGPPPPGV